MSGLSLGLGLSFGHPLFSGLLNAFPGAAAAYSLRRLGSYGGPVVEVRRSSDSDTESFTENQILSGAMLDFVNNGTTDLYNSARYFNGTSTKVSTTLSAFPDLLSPIEFTATVVMLSSATTDRLYSLGNSGDDTASFSAGQNGSGKLRFFVKSDNGQSNSLDSITTVFDGNEHKIKVTYDGVDTFKIFVDDMVTPDASATNALLGAAVFDKSTIGALGRTSDTNFSTGVIYAVNIDGISAYTGLGTSVTAWEDTIDDDDGTESNGAAYTGQPFDGFVSTWYDQSGQGNNATQGTNTQQPKIVDAGSLVVGGLDFDGVDDFLDIPSASGISGKVQSFFALWSATRQSSGDRLMAIGSSGGANGSHRSMTSERYLRFQASVQDFSNDPLSTASIDSIIGTGAVSTVDDYVWRSDGQLLTPVSTSGATVENIDVTNIGICGNTSLTGGLEGKVQELIIYNSDQSANRAGIETNINAFYSIF